jgi:hypothetical protein
MERSPQAARVAAAIRAAMKREGLSDAELRRRIEQLTGVLPTWQWMTRHKYGQVHLTEPVIVKHGPNKDLRLIAQALGVDAQSLADAADEKDSTVTADA